MEVIDDYFVHVGESFLQGGDKKVILRYSSNALTGPEGIHYESPVLENPTKQEILDCCDLAIEASGDYHHVFLEGFEPTGEKDGVLVAEMCFGS
jgi:hypothetical protein